MINHTIGADTYKTFDIHDTDGNLVVPDEVLLEVDGQPIVSGVDDGDPDPEHSIRIHLPSSALIAPGNHSYTLRAVVGPDRIIASAGLLRVKGMTPAPSG